MHLRSGSSEIGSQSVSRRHQYGLFRSMASVSVSGSELSMALCVRAELCVGWGVAREAVPVEMPGSASPCCRRLRRIGKGGISENQPAKDDHYFTGIKLSKLRNGVGPF